MKHSATEAAKEALWRELDPEERRRRVREARRAQRAAERPVANTLTGPDLRRMREALGVSAADVARELRVSRQRVHRVESDTQPVTRLMETRYRRAVASVNPSR